ncbi:sensor histidine kinase [Pantanalinema rosaneae CENA516]|uniref:sensor histidine kinase n=1 Tax=Pantanalinema rosaneae TaxID=1620701 RepID=UPI003D6E4246
MIVEDLTEQPPKVDILIVDDTPENIRFLASLLLEQGYNVRKALNGNMALTAVKSLLPDLVLLDITMPEMDGYEVCKRLKEDTQTAKVPVIFLSALDNVADKVRAFQSGGVDYITKPFQFEEVLARIQTQLTIQTLQAQLQVQNEQLKQAFSDLQKTQVELLQKEKMAALGQLVAGIAHEINNPISFISGNLSPAKAYINDLLHIIELYQQEYPNPSPTLQTAIAEADLDFLVTDLEKLMGSMKTGVERIRSVILALRIFSRLDESDVKLVDLHEGIDSVLLLLEHRLNSAEHLAIQVIKEYGVLPSVTCYASQINQVFLNILNNAIEALEAAIKANKFTPEASGSQTGELPTIWVKTEVTAANTVLVRIQDNGLGIPDNLKSHLFEPFFTTKPIGQGMGLGLLTSYQIVTDKHKGHLTYESVAGQGTEFVVEIPVAAIVVT